MILRLIWHWLILTLALYLISLISPLGIYVDHPKDFFWAALILILVNTFIRPILLLITLPLVILSLGLFILILNGIMLYWIPNFVPGFHVPSFLSAFFGALLLSIITSVFGEWDRRSRPPIKQKVSWGAKTRKAQDNSKVIDI